MLIDKETNEVIDDKDDKDKGGKDGTPTFTDKENSDVIDESGEGTDDKRGREGGEASEDGEPKEGQDPEKEGGVPELSQAEFKASIMGEFKEMLQAQQRAPEQEQPQAPVELTEDQKAGYEERYGVPYKTIDAFTKQNSMLFDKIMDVLDQRLSKFERGDSIRELSADPEFSDAVRHRKDIDEFMNGFDPKFRNDPKMLKSAVYYARGKNAKSSVNRARNEGERNRHIAGAARPSSPGGNNGRSAKPLTETERQAMKLGGFKSESEYKKFKGTKIFDSTVGT